MSKSFTGVLASACTALGAVLVMLLAISAAQPASAAPLSGPQIVAIDVYTGAAQNPANGALSAIDSCVSIPVGGTATVDVVVDSIPTMTTPNTPTTGQGLGGFGGDILFNGAVIRFVDTQSLAQMLAADGGYVPFEVFDPVPDADGDHNFNAADLSTNYEDGAGTIARFTIEGVAAGTSPLTLDDVVAGTGMLTIADSASNAYDSFTQRNGTVVVGGPCGASVSPSPTPSTTTTTPTTSASVTPTTSASVTPTTSASVTPTTSASVTPTSSSSVTPTTSTSVTATPTPTPTRTPTATPTRTATPTATAGGSATPTATAVPTCQTVLAASVNVGATSISVAETRGCNVGDTVRIGTGTANQEDAKIASAPAARLAAGTLTLTAALTKNHAAGETVIEIASASPTASPSKTPGKLPTTGGSGGPADMGNMLLVLALGGALLVAAAGSVIAFRASRSE